MNNHRLVQIQSSLFSDEQKNSTDVNLEVTANQSNRLGEQPINKKVLTPGYKYHSLDWDETYPSLDVYYSLVDHGDFD